MYRAVTVRVSGSSTAFDRDVRLDPRQSPPRFCTVTSFTWPSFGQAVHAERRGGDQHPK